MNKVNFKCWTDKAKMEGTGSRKHAITSIFCCANEDERKEILAELNRINEQFLAQEAQP